MNKILEIKFGSYLYGTDTPNSDLDLKGIYLPTAQEICLHSYKPTITTTRPKQPFERNKKDDVDIEHFSLDQYLNLLSQGQVVALDMLFAEPFKEVPLLKEIYDNRDKILSKDIAKFFGYAKQQAAKYGVKGYRVAALRSTLDFLSGFNDNLKLKEMKVSLEIFVDKYSKDKEPLVKFTECRGPNGEPCLHLEVCNRKLPLHCTVKYAKEIFAKIFNEYGQRALMAEKNEGVDWKALSHAVRVNSEAIELLESNFITFPRPDKDLLLKIKTGQMPYKEVAEIIEKGLEDLLVAQTKSNLRSTPDKEWIDAFIYEVYSKIVKNS